MTRRVVLVACAATKARKACRAEDLYQSQLFRKSKAWANANGDAWFILSARHLVVEPERILAPYEESLTKKSARRRRLWATLVSDLLLLQFVKPGDTVVFLAGRLYRDGVQDRLEEAGLRIEVPMEGLRIGEQLAWLSSNR
jgi:hypothetical protein